MTETHIESSRYGLTAADYDAIARELDAIRARVLADLGESDARYIRRLIRIERTLEIGGRAMIFAGGFFPPAWVAGVASLALSKILDNMEIGHNVIHGQYDFLNDPKLSSHVYEWDMPCPNAQWRHLHNYRHHTHTNIVGQDRDVGYGVLRMAEETPWERWHVWNPLIAVGVALIFDLAIATHDLEFRRQRSDPEFKESIKPAAANVRKKTVALFLKDYLFFPLLGGPFFLYVLAGNFLASLIRNLWAFTVIFCGHFPLDVEMFTEAETKNESRGQWYVRQLLGSANFEGGTLLHVLSGNLSHQIEHHLFPDLPAHRYAAIAPEVRALCERFGLPYHTGSLSKQFASVWGRILKYAPQPKSTAASAA
ncbi:MAG: acyl-CoA desaturase, partial [Polyangiaceae bacterium]|nr:acyl-CoA desaturase [Polyangiaceae bacterium]